MTALAKAAIAAQLLFVGGCLVASTIEGHSLAVPGGRIAIGAVLTALSVTSSESSQAGDLSRR
jgi:hypothetical protein